MRNVSILPILVAGFLFCPPGALAQEAKNSKESKPKGTLTLLGTIKGEVDKVSDGGHKIEVKYKEMVATPNRSSTSTRGSSSAKFRPPLPKEFTLKEKNQEIEVRLLDNAVIRILDGTEAAPPAKGIDKKKSDKATDKKDDKSDAGDDEHKSKSNQSDTAADKSKDKTAAKSSKKTSEPPLPGKPGDPGSLVKGQVIIITVLREDLPGFSRFVASTIYILGEK